MPNSRLAALGRTDRERETERERERERDKLTESHFLSQCQKPRGLRPRGKYREKYILWFLRSLVSPSDCLKVFSVQVKEELKSDLMRSIHLPGPLTPTSGGSTLEAAIRSGDLNLYPGGARPKTRKEVKAEFKENKKVSARCSGAWVAKVGPGLQNEKKERKELKRHKSDG